ncbi:hypothetical protein LMG32289_03978 [Cupriavidus pampae]|uniref:Uncharacterized protein n=1 Tax=Cupriavidus pampae TaxID=659251 RepID=A0ABM8XD62_9BURK|nr:hypothetical protein LMG32289_03978 [Cupriavidus pampae]
MESSSVRLISKSDALEVMLEAPSGHIPKHHPDITEAGDKEHDSDAHLGEGHLPKVFSRVVVILRLAYVRYPTMRKARLICLPGCRV